MGFGSIRNLLVETRRNLEEMRREREQQWEESKATRTKSGDVRLFDFVKGAWHVLEPDNAFCNNWHVGAICFPYSTPIITDRGLMAIGDIVERGEPVRVLSFNHETGEPEWRQVTHGTVSPSAPMVRLTTADGRKLTTTVNHPVYIEGRGYVRADAVECGDIVTTGDLSGLPNRVSPLAFPNEGRFLQSQMRRRCEGEAADHVRGVWESRSGAAHEALPELLRRDNEDWRVSPLPTVQQTRLQAAFGILADGSESRRILRHGVSRGVYRRTEQSGVSVRQQSGRLPVGVPASEAGGYPSRRRGVLPLQSSADVHGEVRPSVFQYRRTSCGLGQNEQQRNESCLSLPPVSRESAWNTGPHNRIGQSSIVRVERGVRLPGPVYNLEVDRNHNYFASGILVHNCEHLEAVTALEIRNLIINIPPRHAKSLLVSVYWFAWVWTLNPYTRWIYSTYADDFAKRDGQKSRDVLTSQWYQRNWGDRFKLRGDQNAKEKIQNDKQGFRLATTLGGKATGEGGSYFVVDDPMKASDAESPVMRQKVIDWWTGTTVTRSTGDPKTFRRVVVMQRLHERDLSGYLAAEVGGYEHLVIPVEYEPRRYWFQGDGKPKPKDAIIPTVVQRRSITARDPRTEEGELLWPDRWPVEEVNRWKRELLFRAAGQMQQRPADPEGSIFRRATFKTFHIEQRPDGAYFVMVDPDVGDEPGKVTAVPVANCRMFQCADTAVKIKKRNDYTAVVTAFIVPGGRLLIYNVIQVKIESPHLMKFMRSLKYGPTRWDAVNLTPVRVGHWPNKLRPFRQYIEDAASGSGLLQTAIVEGTPMHKVSNAGDKVEKAIPLASMYENGMVYHLAAAEWRSDFEDELVTFPNAAHDDRTDAAGSCGRVATEDRALRMGMVSLVEVAEDYPEFADWQREEERKKKILDNELLKLRDDVLDSVGMSEKKKAKPAEDDPDTPISKTYKIKVSGGDLELNDD